MSDKWKKTADELPLDLRMRAVEMQKDFLVSPFDAFDKWDPERSQEFLIDQYTKLCAAVARKTGSTIESVLDEKTRTPAQQKLMSMLVEYDEVKRLRDFDQSNYNTVMDILSKVNGQLDDVFPPDQLRHSVKMLCTMYFFAKHTDINPVFSGNITEDMQPELAEILYKIENYLLEAYKTKEAIASLSDSDVVLAVEKYALSGGVTRINVRALEDAYLVLDKLNSKVWSLTESDTGEEIKIKVEKHGSKKKLNIIYSIDFDNLTGVSISKNLTPFDKSLYCRCADLYRAGYEKFTLKQLYNAMGHAGVPGANDKRRISNSLKKMSTARVQVDNTQEAVEYNYDKFVYWGSLLPSEGCEVIANGKLAETAVHLLTEPPLVRFARQRGQITTIKAELLSMPLSSTDENIQLQDYLLIRIAKARSGSMPRKILYSTIYDELKTKRDRKRVRDKIETLMSFFVQKGHITGYKMTDTAVEFNVE